MIGLNEFLVRCVETEERLTKDAQGFDSDNWNAKHGALGPEVLVGPDTVWAREVPHAVWTCDDYSQYEGCDDMRQTWMQQARHIARWSPERILAECSLKQEILRIHESVTDAWDQSGDGEYDFGCGTCHYDMDCGNVVALGYCATVLAIASHYRKWPGYKKEWHDD